MCEKPVLKEVAKLSCNGTGKGTGCGHGYAEGIGYGAGAGDGCRSWELSSHDFNALSQLPITDEILNLRFRRNLQDITNY